MSDKIAEIRERWAEFESLDHQSQVWDSHLYMRRAHNDRATLLAEVDRLRADNERLRAEMLDLAEWCETEEPLSYKQLSYRLRAALEGKP